MFEFLHGVADNAGQELHIFGLVGAKGGFGFFHKFAGGRLERCVGGFFQQIGGDGFGKGHSGFPGSE